MSKYKNKRVEYNGILFDSIKERDRYIELVKLEDAGEIFQLERQIGYELIAPYTNGKGEKIRGLTYRCDFRYLDKDNKWVIEDVKSSFTEKDKVFQLKKKLFESVYYPWVITIVK